MWAGDMCKSRMKWCTRDGRLEGSSAGRTAARTSAVCILGWIGCTMAGTTWVLCKRMRRAVDCRKAAETVVSDRTRSAEGCRTALVSTDTTDSWVGRTMD